MTGQIIFTVVMLAVFVGLAVHQARQKHLRQVDDQVETVLQSAVNSSSGSMDGKRPTPIVRDAHSLLARGIDALERNHIDQAVGLLSQTVQIDAESFHGHLALGIALTKALDIPAAERGTGDGHQSRTAKLLCSFADGRVVSARRSPKEGEGRVADRAGSWREPPARRKSHAICSPPKSIATPRRAWRPDFAGLLGRKRRE